MYILVTGDKLQVKSLNKALFEIVDEIKLSTATGADLARCIGKIQEIALPDQSHSFSINQECVDLDYNMAKNFGTIAQACIAVAPHINVMLYYNESNSTQMDKYKNLLSALKFGNITYPRPRAKLKT